MRLEPDQRRAVITTAALRIARDKNKLTDVTHGSVAKRCTVATSEKTVRHYFQTRRDLWLAVVKADKSFVDQLEELGIYL